MTDLMLCVSATWATTVVDWLLTLILERWRFGPVSPGFEKEFKGTHPMDCYYDPQSF